MTPREASALFGRDFRRIISAAVEDMSSTGYVSAERADAWVTVIREAAKASAPSDRAIDDATARRLDSILRRFVEGGGVRRAIPGVHRFTIESVRPDLRAELDRRIMANADLIKLRRDEAIEKTLRRFSGWSTSIPPGGSTDETKRETVASLMKPTAQEKFERRRVDIDQGHKLIQNAAAIVAQGAGAIAGEWHDHGEHDASYDYREDHLERTGKIYAIRGSWADAQGLFARDIAYTDQITAPGQEVYCRCWYRYITSPRRLPRAMLSAKGRAFVDGPQRAAA